jgi:hypothetical protein
MSLIDQGLSFWKQESSAEAQAVYTSRDKQPIGTNALHRHTVFAAAAGG